MPKGKQQKKKQERPFHGFVPCDLSAEQKKEAKEYLAANVPTWDSLIKLIESDYKVSFSYDDYHSTFQCTLMATRATDPNYGWCLVGRAPDAQNAYGMVLYKHYMILDGLWTDGIAASGDDQDWG